MREVARGGPRVWPRGLVLAAASLLVLGGCGGGDGEGRAGGGLGLSGWDGTGMLAVEDVLVFTSPLAEPLEDGVVIIAEGRIEAVGVRGEVLVPQPARRVSAGGASLLAGFWDAHVRLDPGFLELAADPLTPRDELEGWLEENITGLGFTAVVDTGTPLAEIQPLLDRMRAEGLRGPLIVATGGAELQGVRVAGADPAAWSDETLGDLLLAEATLVPALALRLPSGDASDAEIDRAQVELAGVQGQLGEWVALGGRTAFGSGFGWGASQDPILELQLMEEARIGFVALLESLTTEPVLRFGFQDRGEVETGMVADLVLVDGDPRVDLSALARVRWVMRGGVPIHGTVR